MNRIGLAIKELHRTENDLAGEFLAVADRHRADHDIFYIARDLAVWSHRHMSRLDELAGRRGIALDHRPRAPRSPKRRPPEDTVRAVVRKRGAELVGHGDDSQLVLLSDLRRLHQMAAGVSLDWEILAQAAQALKDAELLALAQQCHPGTLRQLRWANALLKQNAPQIMATPAPAR